MFSWIRNKLVSKPYDIAMDGFPAYDANKDIIELPDATITPLRFLPDQDRVPSSLRAETGVYTLEGKNVLQSQLFRNGNFIGIGGDFSDQTNLDRPVLYCGRWLDHFGHFLLESLARLWCAAKYPDHCLCWSVEEGSSAKPQKWQADIIRTLCGDREIMLIDQATRFSNVAVPRAGFVIPNRFDENLKVFFEKHGRPHNPQKGNWVWLSRSNVEPDTGLLNSAVLERHLERAGWQIVYPETLSIDEQLDCLASAERVAGEQGSALHLLLLLGSIGQLTVDIFPRRSSSKKVREHYELIARQKGFSQRVHDFPNEKPIVQKRPVFKRIAPDFSLHLNALDIPLVHESSRSSSPADASILQIGLSDAYLTNNADSALHENAGTLITASGKLDPRLLKDTGCQIFEMTLPQYTAHFHEAEKRFRKIHITGEFSDINPELIREQLATDDAVISVDGR